MTELLVQQKVKKRVVKPDGTISEEYFEPGQFLRQPPTSYANTTPAQVSPRPHFMLPQPGGFLSQLGEWISNPENFGLIGQIANAVAPNTAGGNLGAVANAAARGQLFQQLLGKPSAKAASLLGPELQSAALEQFRQDQQADLARKQLIANVLLGQAELGTRETPEQRLRREAIITLLGQQPARPEHHRVSINVDASGKQTPPHEKHVWAIDDAGNLIKHIGPDTQVISASKETDGLERQRSELAEIKHAEDQAYELLAVKYPGKLVKDPTTGRWALVGEVTNEIMQDLANMLGEAVRAKQRRGVIQDPIDIPPIGTISTKLQPPAPTAKTKRKY